jgi:hypothetical protein
MEIRLLGVQLGQQGRDHPCGSGCNVQPPLESNLDLALLVCLVDWKGFLLRTLSRRVEVIKQSIHGQKLLPLLEKSTIVP